MSPVNSQLIKPDGSGSPEKKLTDQKEAVVGLPVVLITIRRPNSKLWRDPRFFRGGDFSTVDTVFIACVPGISPRVEDHFI